MEIEPERLAAMRAQVRELQLAGNLVDAIQVQVQLVNGSLSAPQDERADDLNRLAVMLFAAADFAAAAQCFAATRQLRPTDPLAALNVGLSLIRVGRLQEAIAALHEAEPFDPERLDLLDGLAEAYGKLGQMDRCRHYGERSLVLKDQRATAERLASGFSVPAESPLAFQLDGGKANVIAFSLFGAQPRYLDGALRNAAVAPYVYPGWRCRFYCDDSVPPSTRSALSRLGADVVLVPKPQRWSDALFWRFLVAEDPSVGRFLVRDCDSVVNVRESAAVNEWLASPFYFHAMRDFPSHTDLLLAGMWGGVAGVLPRLATLLEGFGYDPRTESRTADQRFLGRRVWPLIRSSCLIHDRCYRCFGARPFPAGTDLPGLRHIGENDFAAGNGWTVEVLERDQG